MKSCKEVREQFLETPVAADVKEHVAACSECAEAWKGFEKTMALLDEWRSPEPSPFFETRFRARFNELKEQEALRSQGWFAWLRGPVWRPVVTSYVWSRSSIVSTKIKLQRFGKMREH